MLRSSDLLIKLNPSKDYLKIVIFSHILAVGVVWHSSFPLAIDLPLLLILMINFCLFFYSKKISILSCHAGRWFLTYHHSQSAIEYEKAKIGFESVLFLWITLTSSNQHKKTLIIFHDQMTKDDYRRLKLLEY